MEEGDTFPFSKSPDLEAAINSSSRFSPGFAYLRDLKSPD